MKERKKRGKKTWIKTFLEGSRKDVLRMQYWIWHSQQEHRSRYPSGRRQVKNNGKKLRNFLIQIIC